MICPNCSNNLPDNSQFCNRCGFNFIQYQQQQNNAYVQPNYNNQYQQQNYVQQPQPINQQEKPQKSIGCITYFGIVFFSLLTILLIALNASTSLIAPFVVLDIALIIYSIINTPKNKSLVLFLVFVIIFVIGARLVHNIQEDNTTNNTTTKQSTETYTTEQRTEAKTTEEITTEEIVSVNIPLAKDFSRMKLGDICNNGDLYIGLSYVKLAPTLTNFYGYPEDISSDKQVLFAFFDIYNGDKSSKRITDDDFSCYIDGNSVSALETYFYYIEDGITNNVDTNIESGTNKLLLVDFEIPLEFNEVKLYYKSDCIWTLKAEQITTEPFVFNSMYDIDYLQNSTAIGEKIYSDKYNVTYDGYGYYPDNYFGGEYIIFKFTVDNTSSTDIDYGLAGYEMQCYADNYVLDSADYSLDEKIDDYTNIYNVETIHSGMTSKIYISFWISHRSDFYRMIFNTGYISDEILGEVFVNEQTATDTDTN